MTMESRLSKSQGSQKVKVSRIYADSVLKSPEFLRVAEILSHTVDIYISLMMSRTTSEIKSVVKTCNRSKYIDEIG